MTTLRKLPMMAPRTRARNARAIVTDPIVRLNAERRMQNEELRKRSFLHSAFCVLHSECDRYFGCYLAGHELEANGGWWPPRSSKPLFRRGGVERLVRFRRASA